VPDDPMDPADDELVEDDLPGLDDSEPSAPPQPPAEPLPARDVGTPIEDVLRRLDEGLKEAGSARDAEATLEAFAELRGWHSHINDLLGANTERDWVFDRAYGAMYEAFGALSRGDPQASDLMETARREVRAAEERYWEGTDSVVDDLAPLDLPSQAAGVPEHLMPERDPRAVPTEKQAAILFRTWRIPILIGGGILGILLGFWIFSGDSTQVEEADAAVTTSAPAAAMTPTTTSTAIGEETEPTSVEPDPATAAFPALWVYTATKTRDLLPPPDFLDVGAVGTQLPWTLPVTETCTSDTCTYSSDVVPFFDPAPYGEVPSATWTNDGADWELEVTWHNAQADYGDGTVCLVENRWIYRLTVTEASIVDGRNVASAIEGTWEAGLRLDLDASTGDLEVCGSWEFADEWSVTGSAG